MQLLSLRLMVLQIQSVAADNQGVAIDPGITVTNADDTQEGHIASAVVEITNNASTGDELLFVNTAKVVLGYF